MKILLALELCDSLASVFEVSVGIQDLGLLFLVDHLLLFRSGWLDLSAFLLLPSSFLSLDPLLEGVLTLTFSRLFTLRVFVVRMVLSLLLVSCVSLRGFNRFHLRLLDRRLLIGLLLLSLHYC